MERGKTKGGETLVKKMALIDTECSIDCLLFFYFNKLNSTCFVWREKFTAAHNKWANIE